MKRHEIRVSSVTNPENEIERFRRLAAAAGVESVDFMAIKVQHAIEDFLQRGREVSGTGVALSIKRTINDDNLVVTVTANFNQTDSMFDRLTRNLLAFLKRT